MSNPLIPQRLLVGGPPAKRRTPCAWRSWWTPERDAKMLFVMEVYGDLTKAARVLGIPPGNGGWIVKRLKNYRNGKADLTEADAKEVELLLNELLAKHRADAEAS